MFVARRGGDELKIVTDSRPEGTEDEGRHSITRLEIEGRNVQNRLLQRLEAGKRKRGRARHAKSPRKAQPKEKKGSHTWEEGIT